VSFYFEIGSLYVIQVGLELVILSLLGAGITGMLNHTWPEGRYFLFPISTMKFVLIHILQKHDGRLPAFSEMPNGSN
jgi:hypothetical protein